MVGRLPIAVTVFLIMSGLLVPGTEAALTQQQCNAGLGGSVISGGGEYEIEMRPSTASFTNVAYLSMPTNPEINLGDNKHPGLIIQLGKVKAGEELIFKLFVTDTKRTYFSGPASRNFDKVIHAKVTCFAEEATIAFEDLQGGGDFNYNDMVFRLRAKKCGPAEDPIIPEMPECGPGSLTGNLNVKWGKFGEKTELTTKKGETLTIKCATTNDFEGRHYEMHYSGPKGNARVGICPWEGGCNSVQVFYAGGDAQQPECLVRTQWRSQDLGHNDLDKDTGIGNPWWKGSPESAGFPEFDIAQTTFDANSGNLSKADLRFKYKFPGPAPVIAMSLCQDKVSAHGASIGAIVGLNIVDPPIGPTTEAFFNGVVNRMGKLPAGEPMRVVRFRYSDVNIDGEIDDADRAIFTAAVGSCRDISATRLRYDARVDFNLDGCVTLLDRDLFEYYVVAEARQDAPPVAACKDIELPANGSCLARVAAQDIDNGSVDPEGLPLTYAVSPAGPLGLGVHDVTLTVNDGASTASCVSRVRVTDQTAPALSALLATPSVLWPPNHRLVDTALGYSVQDNCTAPTSIQCDVGTTSSEAVNGTGDGDTAPDWVVVGPKQVKLRAERSGNGPGRTYTITATCRDAAGLASSGSTTVTVPHSR